MVLKEGHRIQTRAKFLLHPGTLAHYLPSGLHTRLWGLGPSPCTLSSSFLPLRVKLGRCCTIDRGFRLMSRGSGRNAATQCNTRLL